MATTSVSVPPTCTVTGKPANDTLIPSCWNVGCNAVLGTHVVPSSPTIVHVPPRRRTVPVCH